MIAVADQQALADEVTETNSTANVAVTTTGNPATNLPEAQGEATEAASQSQAQAGSKDGALPVEVSADDLNKAVTDAKAAGVNVVQDQTSDKGQPQLPQKMRKSKLKLRVTTLNKLKKKKTTELIKKK